MQYELKRDEAGKLKLSLTVTFNTLTDAMNVLNAIENSAAVAALNTMELELLPMIKVGNMFQAIKFYRDKSGEGIKESKNFCDALSDKFRKLNLLD